MRVQGCASGCASGCLGLGTIAARRQSGGPLASLALAQRLAIALPAPMQTVSEIRSGTFSVASSWMRGEAT